MLSISKFSIDHLLKEDAPRGNSAGSNLAPVGSNYAPTSIVSLAPSHGYSAPELLYQKNLAPMGSYYAMGCINMVPAGAHMTPTFSAPTAPNAIQNHLESKVRCYMSTIGSTASNQQKMDYVVQCFPLTVNVPAAVAMIQKHLEILAPGFKLPPSVTPEYLTALGYFLPLPVPEFMKLIKGIFEGQYLADATPPVSSTSLQFPMDLTTSSRSLHITPCPRLPLTEGQVHVLRQRYQKSRVIDTKEGLQLGARIGLEAEQVIKWFKDFKRREMREKKMRKLSQQQQILPPTPPTDNSTSNSPPALTVISENIKQQLLLGSFKSHPFISLQESEDLAKSLGITGADVRGWFYEKRNELQYKETFQRIFNSDQLEILRRHFKMGQGLSEHKAREIGQEIGASARDVEQWYKTERKQWNQCLNAYEYTMNKLRKEDGDYH